MGRCPAWPGRHKLAAVAPQDPRRPAFLPPRRPGGRKVSAHEAGSYLGCPACGRFLKIEWAVRSVVCSCGARVPVSTPAGNRS